MSCVFFTLSPDSFAKCSVSFNVFVNAFSDPSNFIVMSSANCTNLKSMLLILIPLVVTLFLIFIANISAQRIKMKVDIGSPCLQPRFSLKIPP